MHVAFFILISLIILLLVSGGYVFVVGCVRRKELPWLVEDEIKKTSYKKYYDYIVLSNKFLTEKGKAVNIKSFDGLKLHGIWVEAENPKGTILLAHGYRSTKLVDFALVYELYHKLGMNILVPDQRSHGESEGKYITFGVKESRDMVSWVEYHNASFGKFPLILSGLSMGASTVLYLADADLPDNVKGIIAYCGFTSPKEIISSVFHRMISLPAGPALWVADLFTRVFAGFRLDEKDTRQTLKNSKLPVLMVHGTGDGFVPCEMTQQGYDVCTGKKDLLLVEGAEHGVSFLVDREGYTEKVLSFLRENVEGFQ